VSNQTGDNCTSSIVGTDEFPFWLVGQGMCLCIQLDLLKQILTCV
jgi:hypothetical protein